MYQSGELTAAETISHLIVTNRLEECIISIPNPFDEDNTIDLYVQLGKSTKNDVKIVNGSPYISCNVNLDARVLSADRGSNYLEDSNIELIESYANSYMKSELENYFYKTSKSFNSDIALLGKHAVKYFNTWDEWTSYDWLDNYANAFFNVDVKVNVISSYLIS